MTNLTPSRLAIAPRKVLAALVLLSLAFGAASVFGQYLRFFHGVDEHTGIYKFDVEEEANFPTYYSTLLLLVAACLLAIVARTMQLTADALWTRWRALAVLFFFLSVDEVAGVHEEVGKAVPETDALGGTLYYGWVVVYAVLVVAVGWYILPALRALPRAHRMRFVLSAVVYVSGALFVELIEGAITIRTGDETWRYQLVSTVQEVAEMLGVALFIWALLKFIESRDPVLQATVEIR